MKKLYLILFAFTSLFMASCDKTNDCEEPQSGDQEQVIPENDLKVFKQMGYDTRSIQATEAGYLVNNSLVTTEQLNEARASFLWFQVRTDIVDPVYTDLSQTHFIYSVFDNGTEPFWRTTKATATLYNQDTHEFVDLHYMNRGDWSFQLTKRGTYTASITIEDGVHQATTMEKTIILKPVQVYNKVRYVIEDAKEVTYIEFYSDPACTKSMKSPYTVECVFSTWFNRYDSAGNFVDGTRYADNTIQIPYGVSSYKLYEKNYIGFPIEDVFKNEAKVESLVFNY